MAKEIQCPCGAVIRGETDESVVADAQKHAKEAHDMDLSEEQALSMARPT